MVWRYFMIIQVIFVKQWRNRTMKKNRSFGRNLKKQMRNLVDENKALRSMHETRAMSYMHRLYNLENRIKRIDNQYVVSELECAELLHAGRFPKDVVCESMLRDIVYSEYLKNLIKVDVDRTFCGTGTRYIVSLQVLEPCHE